MSRSHRCRRTWHHVLQFLCQWCLQQPSFRRWKLLSYICCHSINRPVISRHAANTWLTRLVWNPLVSHCRQAASCTLCITTVSFSLYNGLYSVSQKIPLPEFFIFSRTVRIFNRFLHTYYTFLWTLDYKFLFSYLQRWRSYAILSATT